MIAAQTLALDGVHGKHDYPDFLRRIRPQSEQALVFLINRTGLDVLTIGTLYRSRWQVGQFFKWCKGNLRVKRFFGTLENAVK